MRVSEDRREAYDAKLTMIKPRASTIKQHVDPPSASITPWLDGTDNDSRKRRRENREDAIGHSSMSKCLSSTNIGETRGVARLGNGSL